MVKLAIAGVLGTAFLTTMLFASYLPLETPSLPAAEAQPSGMTNIGCVEFDRNGEPIGERKCSNRNADDMHIAFKGSCTYYFTNNGEPIDGPSPEGPGPKCPEGSNDVTIVWSPDSGSITKIVWTKKGKEMGSMDPPREADDFHLEGARIVLVTWTKGGMADGDPIPAPAGSNSATFDVAFG